MRSANVFRNKELAGVLTEDNQGDYHFTYTDEWFADQGKPSISLTLPKSQREFHSEILFPVFFNMLSEGVNRILQSRMLQIDENDHFGLLIATAKADTIGAITVEPL